MSPSPAAIYFIILLRIFHGVGGVNFTFVNNCPHTIWPAILGEPSLETTGFELPKGSSRSLQAPADWAGTVWGRTGCNFGVSGRGTCATGDCGSGKIQCGGMAFNATTLINFDLGPPDMYYVSLTRGYNLPVTVEATGGKGQCPSVGCVEDLNPRCPAELRIKGVDARRRPCEMYRDEKACGESSYLQVFKSACPNAMITLDDPAGGFRCTAVDYVCTFCSTLSSNSAHSPSTVEEPEVPAPAPSAETPGSFGVKTKKRSISWPSYLGIIGGLLLGITLITALAIKIVKSRRSKSKSEEERNRIVEKFILQQESLAPKRYKYSEIKKMTKSFSDKLGQGGYGSVYKGMLPNGSLVAVKVLVNTYDSNGEEFMNEVASISRTSHVNIVNLAGFCLHKSKRASTLGLCISTSSLGTYSWMKTCVQKYLISGLLNCARRSRVYCQCSGQEAPSAILLPKYSPGILEEFLINPMCIAME